MKEKARISIFIVPILVYFSLITISDATTDMTSMMAGLDHHACNASSTIGMIIGDGQCEAADTEKEKGEKLPILLLIDDDLEEITNPRRILGSIDPNQALHPDIPFCKVGAAGGAYQSCAAFTGQHIVSHPCRKYYRCRGP